MWIISLAGSVQCLFVCFVPVVAVDSESVTASGGTRDKPAFHRGSSHVILALVFDAKVKVWRRDATT
jgi:hypothetical protein